MARLVYACRFDVLGEHSWDLVVAPAYEAWITARYARAYDAKVTVDVLGARVTDLVPLNHVLSIDRYEAEGVATRINWAFPGDQGLIWRNVIRMAALPDGCAVEHQVQLQSADYLVAPASFNLGAPSVVRTICEKHVVKVGDMRLRPVVYPLSIEGVDDLIDLLTSLLRRLPVVLVTPFANGDSSEIDANALAASLAGVAIVIQANNPHTTRTLSDRIGRLGCYDGGVRIYWPGFKLSDDVRRHPLILGSRIALLGVPRTERSIERSIFSVAAFRFVPDPRIDAIVDLCEAARRADRAAAARQEGDTTWEQFALEISEDLDRAKSELMDLKAENVNLRANQKLLFSFSDDEPTEEDEGEVRRDPATVVEAVKFGKTDFANLLFLDSSIEAAQKSPFKRPAEIYETLSIMNKVAGVWKRNEGGGDLRQMLIDGGLGRRVSSFISQTAKGKWGDDYTFSYNGERQIFAPHITLGAGAADTCASIHFLPDASEGKLVIAHVGRHLSNTRS